MPYPPVCGSTNKGSFGVTKVNKTKRKATKIKITTGNHFPFEGRLLFVIKRYSKAKANPSATKNNEILTKSGVLPNAPFKV